MGISAQVWTWGRQQHRVIGEQTTFDNLYMGWHLKKMTQYFEFKICVDLSLSFDDSFRGESCRHIHKDLKTKQLKFLFSNLRGK